MTKRTWNDKPNIAHKDHDNMTTVNNIKILYDVYETKHMKVSLKQSLCEFDTLNIVIFLQSNNN